MNAALQRGKFVISLDFELMWGVADTKSRASYGANILGAREAIPRMLDLFQQNKIRATWATVGFLFCETKDELIAAIPGKQPIYANPRLSNYTYIKGIGKNEKSDPYHFGASLVELIQKADGQELATHTMSHFYCLEPGAQADHFSCDLDAALALAARRGINIKSIVFPRNQYGPEHLQICRDKGIGVFRGNESSWAYRPAPKSGQTQLRRATRLVDSYINLCGQHVATPVREGGMVNVPSSRFLRPWSAQPFLEGLRLHRIKQAMSAAARRKTAFHLWWHPHNFGVQTDENMRALEAIVAHFRRLSGESGYHSANMRDFS